jgi:hypothetical protein
MCSALAAGLFGFGSGLGEHAFGGWAIRTADYGRLNQNHVRREKRRNLLKRSMSAGVTCCVPEIHCILLMVGRGGISSSGFRSMSFVRSLESISNLCSKPEYVNAYSFKP